MIDDVLTETELEMDGAIEALKNEFSRIRTGRAHPGMLDHVQVDYYGTHTPIRSLAQISVQEGRCLVVQPYDKGSMKALEQAIAQQSGLNVPVQSDGILIRVTLPELTSETRKTLVKEMRKKGEEGKVRIRTLRREANDKVKALEKGRKLTEDLAKKGLEDVQVLTDRFVESIDKLMAHKEKDITEI